MNLKELSLFLTDELFVIKGEVNEKLAVNKMASRLDLNTSTDPIVASEPDLQPTAIEHDPEPIPYEGGFQKSILVIYEGEELKESNRAFLLKVFSAVNLSLKDIALMSEHSLKGSNEDPLEQLNPDKLIIFGTIYHHLMRLKKDNYHITQESLDYFFADDLDGLEKNVSLKRKLWDTLQVFFNIKQ
ncbi:hypothetical protein [Cyclobacterium qasimii]|uniref:Uncharacterized protein n=2 Tax=Cyclobacterium qasimii TaxID=1350429 RepID=S7WPB1_9BACT|nr:hypothetical protein [Cyclobacterium qasimii]EPR65993.1 hypothetical protein ADICYQ_5018 [Cyclobacterium qasimii M12-11B]GEO21838.1 hypothetical protein CQA01_23720 [Cyclobacterium qasimii]